MDIADADLEVLEIGCGTQPLEPGMRSAGFAGTYTGIDNAETALTKLAAGAAGARTTYAVADATALEAESGTYDLVVDKGTIDAVNCADDEFATSGAIVSECARVLAPGGAFVIVSHMQPGGGGGGGGDSDDDDDDDDDSDDDDVDGLAWVAEVVGPALEAMPEFSWKVECHYPEDGDGPAAWIIRKSERPRKRTRSVADGQPAELDISLSEY